MTEYHNRLPPEGINVSDTHPLKEFAVLAIGIGSALFLAIFILAWLAQTLAPHIPFSAEQRIADSVASRWLAEQESQNTTDNINQRISTYLNDLAQSLAIAQSLPPELTLQVHYIDDETVNAFATLGGHIMIHRGLLESVTSENALAMVLAHEIAHIHHRDPIVAAGRGMTIALLLASITGTTDSGASQAIVTSLGNMTALSFNRSQEQDADTRALHTLHRHYGHTLGATEFFVQLEQQDHPQHAIPELLQTHPLPITRIEALTTLSNTLNQADQPVPAHTIGVKPIITPLPEWLREHITTTSSKTESNSAHTNDEPTLND